LINLMKYRVTGQGVHTLAPGAQGAVSIVSPAHRENEYGGTYQGQPV
jgi:hypothetical protein